MHVLIAITYGLTIWMASVIYATIAAPTWAGMAIALAPITISGSVAAILLLDWTVASLSRFVCKTIPSWARKAMEKSRAA